MFEKIITRVSKSVGFIAVIDLLVLMFFITVDVVARYIFEAPIRGGYEVAELMMAVLVLLGLPYTGVLKGHISVDILITRFPALPRKILEVINRSVGVLVFFLIGWQAFKEALYTRGAKDATDILHIPLFPFRLLLVVGAFLLGLVLLVQVFEVFRQNRTPAKE